MFKYSKFLVLAFLLSTTISHSQQLLTLENAIQAAVEKNFSIKIAKSRQEIAQNDNTRGNAGMLPVVTGASTANFNRNDINQEFFPVGTSIRPPLVQSGVFNRSTNSSVNAFWTVYDGLGMFATAERLREIESAGKINIELAVENTVAQVCVAYYDIIRQKQRLRALQNALDISKTRLGLAQANYEVGATSKSDFLAAQVDYNEDQAALVGQEQSIQNSKINLNGLMIRDFLIDFNVPDTIINQKNLDITRLRTNVMTQNPAVLLANFTTKIASISEKEIRSTRMPQVDLLASYGLNTINNEAGFGVKSGRTGSLNYGARLTVPIYDGHNQRRREQNARINTLISEQQQQDVQNQLLNLLERNFNNYQNSLKLIEFEVKNLKIARQNVDLAFERYRVGNSTAIEFREAQRNAIGTESRLIEAAYNVKITEIELLRLSSSIIEDVK
jgi:outer membrane protein